MHCTSFRKTNNDLQIHPSDPVTIKRVKTQGNKILEKKLRRDYLMEN